MGLGFREIVDCFLKRKEATGIRDGGSSRRPLGEAPLEIDADPRLRTDLVNRECGFVSNAKDTRLFGCVNLRFPILSAF